MISKQKRHKSSSLSSSLLKENDTDTKSINGTTKISSSSNNNNNLTPGRPSHHHHQKKKKEKCKGESIIIRIFICFIITLLLRDFETHILSGYEFWDYEYYEIMMEEAANFSLGQTIATTNNKTLLFVHNTTDKVEVTKTTATTSATALTKEATTTTTTTPAPPTNSTTTTTNGKETKEKESSEKFLLEEDLDFTKPADCGYNKCFFHSRKNPNEGYLVARSGGDKDTFENMKKAWKDVKRLEEELLVEDEIETNTTTTTTTTTTNDTYTFRHFLAGPTKGIEITKNETLSIMNELASNWWVDVDGRQRTYKTYYGNFDNNVSSSTPNKKRIFVLVQKVHIAPKPSLNLFCRQYQQHRTIQQISNFTKSIKDKDQFLSTFEMEWNQLLYKSNLLTIVPRLLFDFQILIDTKGKIYHIDLDREPKVKKGESKARIRLQYEKIKQDMKSSCGKMIGLIRKSIMEAS